MKKSVSSCFEMDTENLLSEKMSLTQVNDLSSKISGDTDNLEKIWELVSSKNRRISINSLWVITHLPEDEKHWIQSKRDEMIDMLLRETDGSKKRILLQLLRDQEYQADDIRIDLLDYCLSKINSECEPYAVRCFSLYVAFKMCIHYPELLDELLGHLEMLTLQDLSPGLKSAKRQIERKLQIIRKK